MPTQYAKEVDVYRKRSVRAQTALVVAIDADDRSVTQRRQELHDRAALMGGERIAHLVPKWSIETWILCLSGQAVDEGRTYDRAPDIDEKIAAAAMAFFEWSGPSATPPAHCIPSLREAIPEARRLE